MLKNLDNAATSGRTTTDAWRWDRQRQDFCCNRAEQPLVGKGQAILRMARCWNSAADLPDVSKVLAALHKASLSPTGGYFAWG